MTAATLALLIAVLMLSGYMLTHPYNPMGDDDD